jgi:hypothetical protein
MNKSILSILILLATIHIVNGQRYNIAAGLKIRDGVALSGVGRFADKYTAELTLKPRVFSDFSLASLNVKRHWSILGSKRFNVYGGAGMFFRSEDLVGTTTDADATGLSMMVGAELTLGRINISSDYNPLLTFNDTELTKKYYGYSGISVRYVLDKRESSTKKWIDRTRDKLRSKNR